MPEDKKYGIIYADPPWRYDMKRGHGVAENHYPTMSIEEICALPVADLAAKDSALFLWGTFPQLKEAFRVIDAWGFQYKTLAFLWLKQNRKADTWFYGMGFWTRSNAEVCLLAITADMQATVGSLALWLWQNMPFGKDSTTAPELEGIIDDSKVTDHHAILPTVEMARTDLSSLPAGERDVLMLLACRLLCATAQPHRFEAVLAVLESEGHTFTAKGKTILHEGWKGIEQAFRASLKQKQPEDGDENTARLPELKEGQRFEKAAATIREGKTSPPKHYTEDSLLAAMETAGAEDMPEDAERKGLGTSATRAATLEKLVSTGFVQRKRNNFCLRIRAST